MQINRHKYILLLLLLITYNITNAQTHNTDTIMNRKAAVAGQFYAGDYETLMNDISQLFDKAKDRDNDAIAVISPHAGYVFSGEIAASAINQINPDKKYNNIFIIASSHSSYFKGASIYNLGNYETPLGEVKVNLDLCNQLINNNEIFSFKADAHKSEHSIEVQLPLLQFHLKNDFQIVPIVIGTDNPSIIEDISKILAPYFNDDNIFVISSDFSHYPKYQDAVSIDKETADAICSGNPENLIDVVNKYESNNIENLATNICGWSAALTLMHLCEPDYIFKQIDYNNSGDSEYGSHDRVVGYWAISILKSNNSSFVLTKEDKIQLLNLARETIKTKVLSNDKIDISDIDFSTTLTEHCGAFVTLHKDSNLRGCIGRFEPNIPLYEVIVEMAIAASMQDHRFSPVTENELSKIDIEISVLTPMQLIKSIDEIELGRHGIYIRKGNRAGTFLPQVATDTGWSLEEFLGHCARDKAGLSYTGWQDADIYIYEAIIFSEKDFELPNKTKYYEKLENGKVICTLCPHECVLSNDKIGLCRVRKNINGELHSLNFGKPVAIHIDPIEKKPLYHFNPKSTTLSVGTAGCNLHCKNCQNSHISQKGTDELNYTPASPEQIVNSAIENNCKSISYTYTEPTIFYEYMLETAILAHENNLKNIIVSNGYINKEPLLELVPYIDAANIDLKCFNDSIYKKMTSASLEPVLNTLKILKDNNVWLEITNLIIPGWTDDMDMIAEMCDWLILNGFENVPLHFSKFHPSYNMQNVPETPVKTLEQAAQIAKDKGIKFVYIGNVRTDSRNTTCPECGIVLIDRNTYKTDSIIFKGVCPKCGFKINGVWE